ncbi:MAG: DUF5063 domain-containing protein [Bacteroidales bacterium]|nr:DUF5063 domain-containing protein [Bacteroidales bacterium]
MMKKNTNPVYSRNVVEFVAVANEYCKYAEHAADVKGDEMMRIMQRILPLMYLKASLLPQLEPYFEDGNEKFVTEADWFRIHDLFKRQFGSADDYLEVFDDKFLVSDRPVPSSLSENMADIYQDMKDFLLLYQTGTEEVMNDAVWDCKMNFENIWGQKLVNALRAIHKFIYSGEEINREDDETNSDEQARNTSDWIISKRQKEFRGDGK